MTRHSFHSLIRDGKGASVVEFAFAAPILIMFILGTLQIGMVLQANSALREVMGWGGREAMVSYQDSSDGYYLDTTIENMIKAKASDDGHRLKAANLTVDVNTTTDNVLLAKKINIDLDYDVDFDIPLWGKETLTLSENRTFYVPM